MSLKLLDPGNNGLIWVDISSFVASWSWPVRKSNASGCWNRKFAWWLNLQWEGGEWRLTFISALKKMVTALFWRWATRQCKETLDSPDRVPEVPGNRHWFTSKWFLKVEFGFNHSNIWSTSISEFLISLLMAITAVPQKCNYNDSNLWPSRISSYVNWICHSWSSSHFSHVAAYQTGHS